MRVYLRDGSAQTVVRAATLSGTDRQRMVSVVVVVVEKQQ